MSNENYSESTVIFYVNGKKVVEENADPEWTLLYYLRSKLHLCGTKLGCGEGGCGVCTVMVSKYSQGDAGISHQAVLACLVPVVSLHGLSITTIEGIGSTRTQLHVVQKTIAESHGTQCGFCTPGMVMSMYTLLRNMPKPSMKDVETALQGNLCRCTGYRPILEGFKVFTTECADTVQVCSLGRKCCRAGGDGVCEVTEESTFVKSAYVPLDESQEPIFPPELQLIPATFSKRLVIKGKRMIWHRPETLAELLDLRSQYPGGKSCIVGGNTEIALSKNASHSVLIDAKAIKELKNVTVGNKYIMVGACVTMTELQKLLQVEITTQPKYRTRILAAISEMLYWFGSEQIRNVATIGGNIMSSSPISDLNQIFLASKVQLEVQHKGGSVRHVMVDDSFFTGYRKNSISEDEILLRICIPYTQENQYIFTYKQAKRRDDDISIVNIAVNVWFESSNDLHIIRDIMVSYGGMAATTVLMKQLQQELIGREWNEATLEAAYDCLVRELPLSADAPGGMIHYRKTLAASLLFKAFLHIKQQIQNHIPKQYLSDKTYFNHQPLKSSQYFAQVLPDQNETDMIGRPIPHESAWKQASGEAVYCDDMPRLENELYLALVTSSHAHARVKSIDASRAMQLPGVEAFFSAKDLSSEQNSYGAARDEEMFASDKVTYVGHIIGAIVAKDKTTAQNGAEMVSVDYEDLSPVIISIEDAIKHQSFYTGYPQLLKKGDVKSAIAVADHVISGKLRLGGQEHFYLETQCTIAVPKGEDDAMEVFCSTQNPSEAQRYIANMLKVQSNKIVCKVKRLGGAFGGKETRAALVYLPVAFAAHKLNCPVRCMLDREEDMVITGKRHSFLFTYQIGFTKEGEIVACDMDIYINGGNTLDTSGAVIRRAMFDLDNAYRFPNVEIRGYVCRSNIPSNTVFRGSGAPQGMFFAESVIRQIACYLTKDVLDVMKINMYGENDVTHYNQKLENCTLLKCWNDCLSLSDYLKRAKEVEEFNRQNHLCKRGLSLVPTKFGIAFPVLYLNQGSALVLVYEDGSVLLSHGGTECGQGLHTKMIQVASRALGISHKLIYISETSTDKVPNTAPTAASSSSDLNGMAVKNACEIIGERLKLYKEADPKGKWQNWVKAAYMDRVSLAATGHYKTPDIGYNWETNTGQAFNYYTFGAGCSEVEVDCLTGDHKVLRTDLVMDVGRSLNPAVDIGQIEGAFVMGYGLFVLEELLYSAGGVLHTRGPGWYKIPAVGNVPDEFNVSLLQGVSNPRAVYSSKAIGEPPLFLASSVYFAIIEAIKSARADAGLFEWFALDSPATPERIRLAIADPLVDKFQGDKKASSTPWCVRP